MSRGGAALPLKEEIQSANPIRPEHVVLVGDSILALAETSEFFPAGVINRAVAGYTTADVLKRLDEIAPARRVILSAGINDLQRGWSVDRVKFNLSRIKAAVRNITILPLLPVNVAKYRKYIIPRHPGIHMPEREDVEALNKAFASLSIPVLENSEIADRYTLDGLHLNGAGLKILARTSFKQ